MTSTTTPLPCPALPCLPCLPCPACPALPAPAGFIYPVLPKPIGYSRGVDIVPASRPMLRFDGNTAHSSGYMWCVAHGARSSVGLWVCVWLRRVGQQAHWQRSVWRVAAAPAWTGSTSAVIVSPPTHA
jgi:hypothetical protein